MAFVIAIDPGKTSGYARLTPDGFYSTEFPTLLATAHAVSENLDDLEALICEDYIVTQQTIQKSRQNYSLELIGILRYFTAISGLPFVLQTPSAAKSFATDEKLKKIGWYTKEGAGHANDAARHLLVYCVNNGIISVDKLV